MMESKPKRKYARIRPYNTPQKTVDKLPSLWAEGLSVAEIADKLNVSANTVYRWLRKTGIVPSDVPADGDSGS